MRANVRTLLMASAAIAMAFCGQALARHGSDDDQTTEIGDKADIPDVPELDIPEAPEIDVPEPPAIEDHSDIASAAADISDKGETPDQADNSDRGFSGERSDGASREDGDRSGGGRSGDDDRTETASLDNKGGSSNSGSEPRESGGRDNSGSGDNSGPGESSGSSGNSGSGENSGSGSNSGSDDRSGSSESSGSNNSGSSNSGSDDSGSDSSGSNNSGSNSGSSESSSGSNSGSDDSNSQVESASSAVSDDSDVQFAGAGGSVTFETDKEGFERRADEVLALGDPSDIEKIRHLGFDILATKPMGALGSVLARVRTHDGESIEETITALRAAAPNAWVDANIGYRQSSSSKATSAAAVQPPRQRAGAPKGKIGVIDTGADTKGLGASFDRTRSFASRSYTPRSHGTAVSRIAAARGASLNVADVFEEDGKGGAIASADAIARALDWMVTYGTPVINISIEGPPNKVLEEVVQRTVKSGAVVIAAAGNEGPSAAPVYPAAYPGVIAVTAVDKSGQIYRRANRGDYVAFAAFGVKAPVRIGDKIQSVSGTSFAAPVVAAEVASIHPELSSANGPRVLSSLQRMAVDKGAKGKDPIFGWGVIPN